MGELYLAIGVLALYYFIDMKDRQKKRKRKTQPVVMPVLGALLRVFLQWVKNRRGRVVFYSNRPRIYKAGYHSYTKVFI